jgi:L-asparaginase
MKEKRYITVLIIILILCVIVLLVRGKKVEEPGKVPFKNYNKDSRYLVIGGDSENLGIKICDKIDYKMSAEVQPFDWNKLADIIFQNYMSYNGFIVLQRPETITYTASGLSFILENLGKPVVLTENLSMAIKFISKYTIPEVVIIDDFKVYRGCRSKRYKGIFVSPNFPVLCEKNVLKNENVLQPPEESLKILPINTNKKIIVIKMFPNMTLNYIKNILKVPGIYGIILETYENGYVSDDLKLLDYLKMIVKKGVIVVSVSQSLDNVSNPILENIGVISGGTMTTEAAYAKLSLIISHVHKYNNQMVTKLIQNNMRGEI